MARRHVVARRFSANVVQLHHHIGLMNEHPGSGCGGNQGAAAKGRAAAVFFVVHLDLICAMQRESSAACTSKYNRNESEIVRYQSIGCLFSACNSD